MSGSEDELLTAAASALGRPLAWDGEPLRGSDRAVVRRARDEDRTVVVKAYVPERSGDGFLREAAALRLLAGRGAPALELLADRTEPPLIVTADLGRGPSLADALLGRDGDVARAAVLEWADAVAGVHRLSPDSGPEFGAQLAALGGEGPLAEKYGAGPVAPGGVRSLALDGTPGEVDFGVGQLREWLPALGVTGPAVEAALVELAAVPELLARGPHALSPSDTCPDNNVRTASGLVLVDFEGGGVRPVVWDAAYLLAPWPTCWCSWALPEEVAAAGLARWRVGVRDVFPVVDTAGFERDLHLATAAWNLMSSGWFLRNAVGADPPPEDPRLHGLVPSRRAMIQHRLRVLLARGSADRPALAGLAERLLGATVTAWGTVPMPLAPAFR